MMQIHMLTFMAMCLQLRRGRRRLGGGQQRGRVRIVGHPDGRHPAAGVDQRRRAALPLRCRGPRQQDHRCLDQVRIAPCAPHITACR